MRLQRLCLPCLLVTISISEAVGGQSIPAQTPSPPQAQTLTQKPGAVIITLDDAIQMALHHNHNLLAARTTIQQSQAEETTANLRPNPVLLGDSQFLPIFQPSQFNSDYIDNTAQFDLGVSYLFERGKKRQHRLQAAKDQTAVTRSQVADNERSLAFSVASQFINVELAESTLTLANEDLKSFEELRNAPVVSADDYHGPVLFSGDASADILNALFVPNVEANRPEMGTTARTQGAYTSSFHARVLPDFLNATDDPLTTSFAGKTLATCSAR